MTYTLEQIGPHLIFYGPKAIAASYGREPEHRGNLGYCIISARVASQVLKRFGFDPKVVAVTARAYNLEARRLYADLENCQTDDERRMIAEAAIGRGAKIREIDPEQDFKNGWPGHLVVVCENHLIDLDVAQFGKPGYIEVPPAAAFMLGEGFWSGVPQNYITEKEVQLQYQRYHPRKDYRISPDWHVKKRWLPIVNAVEKAIRTSVDHLR